MTSDTGIRSQLELPSFSELICMIEKEHTEDLNYKYCDQDLIHEYNAPNFTTPRTYINKDSSLSRLNSLAHIAALKHFSLYEMTRRKEQELFRELISFFTSLERLFDNLKLIKKKLFSVSKLDMNLFSQSPNLYLVGINENGNQISLSRKDFRKWVIDIPSLMYHDISEEFYKMANNLWDLSLIRDSYKEEDRLNNLQEKLIKHSPKEIPNEYHECDFKDFKRTRHHLKNNIKGSRNFVSKNGTTINSNVGTGVLRYPFKVTKNRTQKKSKKTLKHKSHNLLGSVCNHCGTTQTPEWRKGPDGSRTLCNACGLFYSKLLKKFGANESTQILKQRKESKLVSDRTIPCTLDL